MYVLFLSHGFLFARSQQYLHEIGTVLAFTLLIHKSIQQVAIQINFGTFVPLHNQFYFTCNISTYFGYMYR